MAFLLVALFAAEAGAATPFYPHLVSYNDLLAGSQTGIHDALSTAGIVAVSNIPNFETLRRELLKHAHQCLEHLPIDVARGHVFEDGTERKTIALTTGDTEVLQNDFEGCASFKAKQHTFRQTVGNVARAFARSLDLSFNFGKEPLLQTDTEEGEPYKDIQEIF
jgi:hypothetical protein